MFIDSVFRRRRATDADIPPDGPEEAVEPVKAGEHARPVRSLAKTLTWRVAATTDTFILSFLVTGSFVWASSIASLEVLTKMGLYYLHERVWAHINWGFRQ